MHDRPAAPGISRRVRVGGPVVLAIAVALYVAAYLRWPSLASQVDLLVYRFGATRVWDGQDPYSIGMTGDPDTMLFIYTPFAALCFLPLIGLSQVAVLALGLVVNVACVGYLVHRMLTAAGLTTSAGLWGLTALLVAPILWLEPVRLSLQLGQINLVIMALVVADLLAPASRRWAGVGIGIAAGIKLTPALFIVFLFVTGRRREAVVAGATFVSTIAAGFLLLPTESKHFWLDGLFRDERRISSDPLANTSLVGLLERLGATEMWGLAAAAVLGVVALALAAWAWRCGHLLLGIAVAGMTSAAVSPFSWSHHWVWLVPLVVYLGVLGYLYRSRAAALTLWLLAAMFGGWFVASRSDPPQAGLMSLRHPGMWDQLLPAAYLFAFVVVLAWSVYALWRARQLTGAGGGAGGDLEAQPRARPRSSVR
ncbi:glycosyltransferase 87 family protein [Mycobacterium sp. 852013-51886_SCH5428379]|uniref:glycosyltransferase 87 family protein n=1 Tax=Mycobacterium sp. 852013-51886_SCH5428379 TaxID=1834111 RepID=UPI0009EE8960|nr:glycosyltransferase 87 family protein [Mycobacterium sp. 852013-51886_SCH5428379]